MLTAEHCYSPRLPSVRDLRAYSTAIQHFLHSLARSPAACMDAWYSCIEDHVQDSEPPGSIYLLVVSLSHDSGPN